MHHRQSFTTKILQWYGSNQRPLPWRNTTDPYKIWLSEIILQQTRVAQGTAYYQRFVSTFPTINDLAASSEEQVLKLWQGLGYYSRARNLHKAAQSVVKNFDGVFPKTYKDLLSLPGVGPYTAAAVSSICYGEEQAVVDGNVYRVLSRYFGIEKPINATEGQKYFSALAQNLIRGIDPGTYNQALMEFGALQCKPQSPACHSCPFSDSCWALQHQKTDVLPVKLAKKHVKNRFFNYIVPMVGTDQTAFVQRTQKDIWQKLYEFPLIETSEPLGLDRFLVCKELPNWVDTTQLYLYNEQPWHHKLTHQHIHAYFWIAPGSNPSQKLVVPIDRLSSLPVHKLIERFLHKFFD